MVILTTLAGILFVCIIALILFLECRDLILSTRIRATVVRIVERPGTDDDGHPRNDRFPEIEFVDPSGRTVVHQLALTNVTSRKAGDKLWIYYRPAVNKAGYKLSAPFMWPKLFLLMFLTAAALMLLIGSRG
jgi:hypothetical protein